MADKLRMSFCVLGDSPIVSSGVDGRCSMTPAWDHKQLFEHPAAQEAPADIFLMNHHHSHAKFKKYADLWFYNVFLKVHLRFCAFYDVEYSLAAWAWRFTFQRPFIDTVGTPTAKVCLGNLWEIPRRSKAKDHNTGWKIIWSVSWQVESGEPPAFLGTYDRTGQSWRWAPNLNLASVKGQVCKHIKNDIVHGTWAMQLIQLRTCFPCISILFEIDADMVWSCFDKPFFCNLHFSLFRGLHGWGFRICVTVTCLVSC